jgi:hypothetical protein
MQKMHPAAGTVIDVGVTSIPATDRRPDATEDYPHSTVSAQAVCLLEGLFPGQSDSGVSAVPHEQQAAMWILSATRFGL